MDKIILDKITEYRNILELSNAPRIEFLYNKFEIENVVKKISEVLSKIMITNFKIDCIDFIQSKKIKLDAEVFSLSNGIYNEKIVIDLYDIY